MILFYKMIRGSNSMVATCLYHNKRKRLNYEGLLIFEDQVFTPIRY